MMEPLGLFGAIGTTTGVITTIINLFLNTGENFYKKYKDIRNSEERIRYFHIRLVIIHQSLMNYSSIWLGSNAPPSERACEIRWGKDGYQRIKEMLQDIQGLSCEIEGVLYKHWRKHGGSQISSQSDWRKELEKRLQSDRPLRLEDMSVLEKLLLTTFKEPFLHENTDRLRKMVEDLETFTQKAYWTRLREQNHSRKITGEDVNRMDREDRTFERLSDTMNGLFHDPLATEEKWALVLGSSILEHGLEGLQYYAHCHTHFVINQAEESHLATVRIGSNFEPSVLHGKDDLPMDSTCMSCGILLRYRGKERIHEVKKRLALAKIAKDISKSILLLKSLWTANLCVCCIKVRDGLSTFRHEGERCLRQPHPTFNSFYNFGIVLAQLGTGELCKNDNTHSLLRRVLSRTGIRYHNALEFCFDMGRLRHEFRAEHLKRAVEIIEGPINDYYEVIYEELRAIYV